MRRHDVDNTESNEKALIPTKTIDRGVAAKRGSEQLQFPKVHIRWNDEISTKEGSAGHGSHSEISHVIYTGTRGYSEIARFGDEGDN